MDVFVVIINIRFMIGAKDLIYFFLLITLLVSQSHSEQQCKTPELSPPLDLPYQAHSFNDLNYTKNLLLKGVKYWKFDVSLANRQSCENHSTWSNNSKCYLSKQYSEEICCIAMRGDASSQNDFNHPFNTTEDFLNLFDQFLGEYESQLQILMVAIDFQFNYEIQNYLVEDFVYGLAQLLKKYPKFNAFIKSDQILEMDKICRNVNPSEVRKIQFLLNSEVCTEKRKYISESRIYLQSYSHNPYDVRDYKQRFRNFNIMYKEIDNLCANGFPTWMNKYPEFPLIFWQPSNEQQIQSSLKKLLTQNCKLKHNRTIKGIAFASNIDPQLFENYMKKVNIYDLESFRCEFEDEKCWLEGGNNVKMTKVKVGNDEKIILYLELQDNQKNYLLTISRDSSGNQLFISSKIQVEESIVELHGIQDKIITISKRTSLNIQNSPQFDADLFLYSSTLEQQYKTFIPKYMISHTDHSTLFLIVKSSNPEFLNLYSTTDLKSINNYFTGIYMPVEKSNNLKAMYFEKKDKTENDILIMIGNDQKKTWINLIKNGQILKEKTLTYGVNANLVVKDNGNILILLENSYAHSGLLLNNNAQYKCGLHMEDSSESLASVGNLINMIEVSPQVLINFIQEKSQRIVTACHNEISFFRVLNGEKTDLVSIWGHVFVSSLYVPISRQDFIASIFAGGSNYGTDKIHKKGSILSSFKPKISQCQQKSSIVQEKIITIQ